MKWTKQVLSLKYWSDKTKWGSSDHEVSTAYQIQSESIKRFVRELVQNLLLPWTLVALNEDKVVQTGTMM